MEILKAGIRFLGLAPKTLADIYTDIALIAGALGASDRGDIVIGNMRHEIEEIRTRAASAGSQPKIRPRVFCRGVGASP